MCFNWRQDRLDKCTDDGDTMYDSGSPLDSEKGGGDGSTHNNTWTAELFDKLSVMNETPQNTSVIYEYSKQ